MTRLVNDMRATICGKVIEHRFNADICAVIAEQKELTRLIYEDVFTKAQRATMESLPVGWLPVSSWIAAQIGERMHYFYFNGEFQRGGYKHTHWNLNVPAVATVEKQLPHSMNAQCLKVYDTDTRLGERADIFLKAADALDKHIQGAREKISGTLETFYTTEKLVEAWPEIAPFVPAYKPPEAAQALALPTADLNALFKLPVSADA